MATPSEFFTEIIRQAGGVVALSQNDPERYKLYAGLEAWSLLVEKIDRRLRKIEHHAIRPQ